MGRRLRCRLEWPEMSECCAVLAKFGSIIIRALGLSFRDAYQQASRHEHIRQTHFVLSAMLVGSSRNQTSEASRVPVHH
jgi:hypothetical protein